MCVIITLHQQPMAWAVRDNVKIIQTADDLPGCGMRGLIKRKERNLESPGQTLLRIEGAMV